MVTNQVLDDWKREYRQLSDYLLEMVDWTNHVSRSDMPGAVEARRRLRLIHFRLKELFSKEDDLVRLLADVGAGESVEIRSVRLLANKEHAQLLDRLTGLINRLERASTDFQEWDAIARELNLFMDVLEQHEERELENVGWLMPSSGREELSRGKDAT